jgi:hypothetical protein
LFDTAQIEIFAALQGKVTEQEKLRLNLQLALLQGNASEAERLGKQLAITQLQTTDLATAISKIPMALNPFKGWGTEIDNLLAKMIEKVLVNSRCATKKEQKEFLIKILGNKQLITTLLYSGSIHGWTIKDFHSRSDNRGPIISLF